MAEAATRKRADLRKKGTNTTVKIPRKAASAAKPPKRKKAGSVGESHVYVQKDGTGMVQVGKGTVALMTGEDDVSDWTDEELIRGARMNVKRLPHMIPRAVFDELNNRIITRVRHRFAAEMEVAVREHIRIINSRKASDAVKLKAIGMLYDRVLGKPTETVRVEHEGDPLYLQVVANAIVATPEQAVAAIAALDSGDMDIEEGELVEDEEAAATA